jgi:nucleoside-diphosphate-sugar epimerase
MGHKVVVLDDLSGGYRDIVPNGALFVEGSIIDHALIDSLFQEHQFDYVYHLGAYAAEGLSRLAGLKQPKHKHQAKETAKTAVGARQ